jgi:putative transposase
MARPLRLEFPGALYHVTARGNERKPIYRDEQDRRRFLERLGAVAEAFTLRVHAYVLMRNHYHLLVETLAANLSRAMRQLNGVYTQDFNRRHRRAGHLLQGRYKAIVVDKDSYLLELSRYIHLNPVRVGEVSKPWEFGWSSAGAFVGKSRAPEFLVVGEVLGHFGRRRSTARRRYAAFLLDGIENGDVKPWAAVEGQLLLGERPWVERMKRRLRARPAGREETGGRELRVRPPLSVVLTQVCREAQVERATLLRRRGRGGSWARRAAMALAWELCGLTQSEIGRAFGVGPYAVSKAVARTGHLALSDRRLHKAIVRIKSNVQI